MSSTPKVGSRSTRSSRRLKRSEHGSSPSVSRDPLCATPRKNLFGSPTDGNPELPTTPKSSRPSAKRHNSGTPKRPGGSLKGDSNGLLIGSQRESLVRGRPSTRGRASMATNRSSCGTRVSMGEVVDQLDLASTGGKGRESLPRDSPAERGPVKNLFKEFTEEKHDDTKTSQLPPSPVPAFGVTTKLPIPEELKQAPASVSTVKRSLPSHYKTVLDQFRMLDEVLSLFRVRSQVPYYLQLKAGVERASGKRFAKGRLLQVVFAAGGLLDLEWREKECEVDSMGTSPLRRLVVVQKDASGVVLTKRLDAKEALARAEVVRTKLEELLADQERRCSDPKKFLIDEAEPVPQASLPHNPFEASTPIESTPVLRGRGTPSPDATPQTPCSVLLSGVRARRRERLELSSSPFVPVILPQLSEPMTPARTPSVRENIRSRSASKTPAERRQEMRERVRAKEAKEKEDARIYEEDLKWREQLSFYELLSSIIAELSRLFFMRGHPSMKLQDVVKHFMSANGGGSRYKPLGARVMEDYLRQTAGLAPEWIKIAHSKIDSKTEMMVMDMSVKSKAVLGKVKEKKDALNTEYAEWQSKLPTSPRLVSSTGG
ncbi:DNA replication factor Cdt1, putative [Perkinsus marinus ATCC 50983]|uniref:DNA replication factor Cdt1, putative n=1 Tax=Perkinsus marinus (strain ATCC 50983 / TXsc) TaxID=423536 RepID=C5K7Z4_PERM5|nr:DNA replication factor Cdt1, putative [Perkinsus marinus ATCC 50983]EER19679.1 DNA replication factor Cdt1, putative [Perkinsus marinus ATCC 50983]|eukprot:XP_002787883.1 DNA replication factor Cdt1, putative [Perkinsus marinus ATCC 50983]